MSIPKFFSGVSLRIQADFTILIIIIIAISKASKEHGALGQRYCGHAAIRRSDGLGLVVSAGQQSLQLRK
jgi:hypothetical protein